MHFKLSETGANALRSGRRLFRQPLVPLVGAADGRWLLPAPLAPMLKPGGHGAIWKLMHDQGVFAWLAGCGREAALVRQIRRGHPCWQLLVLTKIRKHRISCQVSSRSPGA